MSIGKGRCKKLNVLLSALLKIKYYNEPEGRNHVVELGRLHWRGNMLAKPWMLIGKSIMKALKDLCVLDWRVGVTEGWEINLIVNGFVYAKVRNSELTLRYGGPQRRFWANFFYEGFLVVFVFLDKKSGSYGGQNLESFETFQIGKLLQIKVEFW